MTRRLSKQSKRLLQILSFFTIGGLIYLYVHPPRSSQLTFPKTSASNSIQKLERRPNALVTEYNEDVARRLNELVDRQADARDPQLIELVENLIDPPSENRLVKLTHLLAETPQSLEVNRLLGGKRNGFFVECGALDGERSSNTMAMERSRDWTGLLIEMDPYFYTQLLGKSRRSWSINACLSPKPYVTKMIFRESEGGAGQLIDDGKPSSYNGRAAPSSGNKLVPCFPLETLLLVLRQNFVDYFSLDVEGFELDILETISFDRINITTLSVEYGHGRSGKEAYVEFMQSKGYRVQRDIKTHDIKIGLFVEDFIFVQNSLPNSTTAQ